MNMYTQEIMALLKIDAETAMKVQDNMMVDFSECSTRAFNKDAKETYAALKATGKIK